MRSGCATNAPGLHIVTRAPLQVGCIVEHEDQVLLCRRGIQPQLGKWTVPAGYMELQESTAGELLAAAASERPLWVGPRAAMLPRGIIISCT